jgi:hypothetical protein
MFKFLTLFARPAPDQATRFGSDPLRYYAPLYCAARNVYMTAETVFTSVDADRLHRALAELHKLATSLDSPAQDLAEIAEWRDALGVRAEQLRSLLPHAERNPDAAPLEVFISKGVIAHEQRHRRASA